MDEAILISFPCIVPPWRKKYFDQISKKSNKKYCTPVFKSHSPHEYIKKIDPKLKIKNLYIIKVKILCQFFQLIIINYY